MSVNDRHKISRGWHQPAATFVWKGPNVRRLILPLLFGIVGTLVLVSLGSWQTERLTWKKEILADIATRISLDPVNIPAQPDPEADRYLSVKAQGTVTSDEIHVLASTRKVGAIYRIIAAFELDDGRRILLDRGYIPLPQKDVERAPVMAQVTGNLHWPNEIDSYTPANDLEANIWFSRDVAVMADHLNADPILMISRSTSENDTTVTPLPVDTQGIPNDHLQYAVTWFGLAIVWVLMTLYYLRRMRKQKKV
jgi:surfeit locus 1 family protein